MKELYSHTQHPAEPTTEQGSDSPTLATQGFPRVVVDGSFVRIDKSKPFIARMVSTCPSLIDPEGAHAELKHNEAILESVNCNLEAGVEMLDSQENSLAKMGGRLADIALSLNKVIANNATEQIRQDAQDEFVTSRDKIRELALTSYNHVALFSNGPSAPIAIAVPVQSSWEGLSISRGDLSTPGLKTLDSGKVYGQENGFFLDHESIKRAFSEWRKLCTTNRLQWSMLKDHIRWIKISMARLHLNGGWKVPQVEQDKARGPLSRPHRNN